jgi:hypothetical protein
MEADGNSRPFLWQYGTMTDLNSLISPDSSLFLLNASGRVNAHGQIAGWAFDLNSGEIHPYLATPRVGAPTSGAPSRRVKFTVPENVRVMVRRTLSSRLTRAFANP